MSYLLFPILKHRDAGLISAGRGAGVGGPDLNGLTTSIMAPGSLIECVVGQTVVIHGSSHQNHFGESRISPKIGFANS